jgi:hypothetical protein
VQKKLLVALLACASVFFSQRLLVVSNPEPPRSIANAPEEAPSKPVKTALLF